MFCLQYLTKLKSGKLLQIKIFEMFVFKLMSGVILGQTCVELSDAALDDLFYFKKFVFQKPV